MRRGVVILVAGVALLISVSTSARAANKYPVSVGISYGSWMPSLDAYNLRFVNQANSPTILPDGSALYLRQRLPDSTVTFFNWYKASSVPFLFSSSWGFGLNARLRLHSDIFALVEYDWWEQSVGSRRNFGGLYGFDGYTLKLNPVTVSLVYDMPSELTSPYWPHIYLGAGAGAVLIERTNTQITNATPVGGGNSTSSGSGTILTGLAGLEYVIPVPMLQDRVSLFIEGRYLTGDYSEQFVTLDPFGSAARDSAGNEIREDAAVSIQGPHIKFGITANFGQIRPRPEKGVLSGLLEPSRRRATAGYAAAPGYGAPAAPAGGGVTLIYPQPQEQVQVVQGAGQIDEDRIRQIIREELLSTRVGTGTVRPVDDLAEQQLRSIRERRLQAEQELQQLKELLREEG